MLVRPAISPGALYRLLQAEFKSRNVSGCTKCQFPLPYRIDRPDTVSANWRIGVPAECVHGCDLVIVEVAASFWPKFDLLGEAMPDADMPARQNIRRSNEEKDPIDARQFLSGVRAIGYDAKVFLITGRMEAGTQAVWVSRGMTQRRYAEQTWIEEALRDLRAGLYGKP